MRVLWVCLLFGILGGLWGCSSNGTNGDCQAGQVRCDGVCIAAGAACGLPDAGSPDIASPMISLSNLTSSAGTLSPAFDPATTLYTLQVLAGTDTIQITPTTTDPAATILVNGNRVASGTASAPITLGTSVNMVSVVVQAPGAPTKTYTIAVLPATVYLKASNTGANDIFGGSISLSGDTLAVGAYQESSNATGVNGNQADNSALNSGAVYVFVRSGTTWTQQAYLKASNTGLTDGFGSGVSLSSDTLAVGAYRESSNATGTNGKQADNSAPSSGAVYVFLRSGTTWTQQAYLKASNTGAGDQFGSTVSLSGDTLAVGAYQESSDATGRNGNQANNSAVNSGAAYLFTRSGATWTQQSYLKASNTDGGDQFGGAVSLSGSTLAVGAFSEASNATGVNGSQTNNSVPGSGAVYIFY